MDAPRFSDVSAHSGSHRSDAWLPHRREGKTRSPHTYGSEPRFSLSLISYHLLPLGIRVLMRVVVVAHFHLCSRGPGIDAESTAFSSLVVRAMRP